VDDETPFVTWTVPHLSFAQQRALSPKPFQASASEAAQYMFNVPDKEALPWDKFRDRIASTGETQFRAVEQQRFEPCSGSPGPNNEVIVGAVLVIRTESMITTLKFESP
jgi:hypothetical protein